MGVNGLWDLVSPVGYRVSNERVRNKILAVDASIWLTQFVKAMRDAEGAKLRNAHLLGVLRRCLKLLFLAVKPVMIFDGDMPLIKRRTLAKRHSTREQHAAKLRRLAEKLLMNRLQQSALKHAIPTHVAKSAKKLTVHEKEQTTIMDDFDKLVQADIDEYDEEQEEDNIVLPNDLDVIDDATLLDLPSKVQSKVLKEMKMQNRTRHREDMVQHQSNPTAFSNTQIEGFLQRTALNQRINRVRNTINKNSGAQNRIASDSSRQYIFEERPSSAKTSEAVIRKETPVWQSALDEEEDDFDDFEYDDDGDVFSRKEKPKSPALDLLARIRAEKEAENPQRARLPTSVSRKEQQQRHIKSGVGWASKVLKDQGGLKLSGNHLINDINKDGDEDEEDRSDSDDEDQWEDGNMEPQGEEPQYKETTDNHINSKRGSESHDDDVEWVDGSKDEKEQSAHYPTSDKTDSLQQEESQLLNEVNLEELDIIDAPEERQGKKVRSPRLKIDSNKDSIEKHVDNLKSSKDDILIENIKESLPRKKSDLGQRPINDAPKALGNVGSDVAQTISDEGNDFEELPITNDENQAVSININQLEKNHRNIRLDKKNQGEGTISSATASTDIFHQKSNSVPAFDIQDSKNRKNNGNQNSSVRSDGEEEVDIQMAIIMSLEESKNQKHDVSSTDQRENITETPTKDSNAHPELDEIDPAHQRNAQQTQIVIRQRNVEGEPQRSQAEQQLSIAEKLTLEGTNSMRQKKKDNSNAEDDIYADPELDEITPVHRTSPKTVPLQRQTKEWDGQDEEMPLDAEQVQSHNHDPYNRSVTIAKTSQPLSSSEVERMQKELEAEEEKIRRLKSTHQAGLDTVSDEMYAETRDLLKLLGIPYLQAPSEAEAQCAFLDSNNVVEGVISEDSDCFLFGAQTVYRKLFASEQFAEAYESMDITHQLGLNRESLIKLAYLLGSDYTAGVRGVGVVNSMEILEAFRGENGLKDFRLWMEKITLLDEKPDEDIINNTENTSEQAVRTRFCWKHRNMKRNWEIRDKSFPNEAVADAYRKPDVDKNLTRFKWGRVDFDGLARFCWEKFAWPPEKFDTYVNPVRRELESRGGPQQRLIDEFFQPHRFAKIRSERLQDAVLGIVGEEAEDLMAPVLPGVPKRKRKRNAVAHINALDTVNNDEENENKDTTEEDQLMIQALEDVERSRSMDSIPQKTTSRKSNRKLRRRK